MELAPLGNGSVSNGAAVRDNSSATTTTYEIHPGDGVSGISLLVNGEPLLVPKSQDHTTFYKLGPNFAVNYHYDRVQLRWPNLGLSGTFWCVPKPLCACLALLWSSCFVCLVLCVSALCCVCVCLVLCAWWCVLSAVCLVRCLFVCACHLQRVCVGAVSGRHFACVACVC